MKTIIFTLFPLFLFSQEPSFPDIAENYYDSRDSICSLRGHVMGEYEVMWDYTPLYKYIDTDSSTILITFDPERLKFECMRCNLYIIDPEFVIPDSTVIWKKDEK